MASSPKKPVDKAADEIWEDIFNSLTIENEPPTRYIKSVIIQTKDGSVLKVSGRSFAEIIEQERYLSPGQSEIYSCKMTINFPKLRADVETWCGELFTEFNTSDSYKVTVKSKRKAAKKTKRD